MLLAPFLWIFCEFDEKVLDNLSLGCRSCVSPLFPVPVLSFASNEARAATTPVIGTQMTPRRTVNWRTTTTNALALHPHRRKP